MKVSPIKKFALYSLLLFLPLLGFSDPTAKRSPSETSSLREKPSEVPQKVEVKATVSDEEISKRLEDILKATEWFTDPHVDVQNGVVFLTGQVKNHIFKDWAGDLAQSTENVTAVINKIVVLEPSIWDLHLITSELLTQVRKVLRALPAVLFSTIILFLAWMAARLIYKLLLSRNREKASLLRDVLARAISFLVFLMGVYFIFEMADFTTMALTVISGTGLLGLIIGIAFRDITENFLASILLSIQNPFQTGDLIDIIAPATGYALTGYVERLTLRVTILLSPEGNHLQIANSTVYKSNIRNYTTHPVHKESFLVGIRPDASMSRAEEISLKILAEQQAVLKNPEPSVLVSALGKEVVHLKVCYWIDVKKSNPHKVKSTLLRLLKEAFLQENIDFHSPSLDADPEKKQTHSEKETPPWAKARDHHPTPAGTRLPEKGENLLQPSQGQSK